MKFWSKSPPALTAWPRMDEPATRSQMLAFARERDATLYAEWLADIESFPKRVAEWEATIADKLAERIPRMVDLLRKSEYGYIPELSMYASGTSPVRELFDGLLPPYDRPSDDPSAWTNQYKDAIAYLEGLTDEELSPVQRRILQRLGCSA